MEMKFGKFIGLFLYVVTVGFTMDRRRSYIAMDVTAWRKLWRVYVNTPLAIARMLGMRPKVIDTILVPDRAIEYGFV